MSLSGAPYSALAVEDHHKLSFDNTCTSHRSFTRSYLADLLRDRTLRNGDLVMGRLTSSSTSGVVPFPQLFAHASEPLATLEVPVEALGAIALPGGRNG
ncbi:MAG: hypothetical protein WAV18_25400 [Roseiarcus sp.]